MKLEAEVARHLNHPSVVTYIGLFVSEEQLRDSLAHYFLVSFYVNSGPAREYLAQHRTPYVAEKLVSLLLSYTIN